MNVNDKCYLLASDSVIFLFLKSVHKTSTIQLIKNFVNHSLYVCNTVIFFTSHNNSIDESVSQLKHNIVIT